MRNIKPTYEQLENQIAELKKQNAILTQSEEVLTEVFQNINNGVCFYDVIDNGEDFIFYDINKAGEVMSNVVKSDIIGKSLSGVRPNIEEFGLIDVFIKVWKTGKPEIHDEKFYDDEKLTGYFKNFVYKSSTGKIVAIFENLTEGKQAVQELIKAKEKAEESEKLFYNLFNKLKSGVAIYEAIDGGKDFIFKYFNESAERIDKQHKEELIGKSIFEARPNIEQFGLINTFRDVLKTKESILLPVNTYKDNKLSGSYENFVFLLPTGELVAVFDDVTERIKYEIELKTAKEKAEESEARFKQIANYTYDWEVFRDASGKLIYSSPAFERITGYNNNDYLAGKITIKDIVHPDDYDAATAEFQKTLNQETISSYEFRLIRKNKAVIYVEIAAQPVFHNENQFVGFRSSLRDITQRKESETILQNINKRFELVVKTGSIGIWDWDIATNMTTWNDIMFDIYQIKKEVPLPYHHWVDRIHPDDIDLAEESLNKVLDNKTPGTVEFKIVLPDNSIRYIHSTKSPLVNEDNEVVRIIGINIDITERKKAEQAIKESEEKFKTVFNMLPDLLCVADLSTAKFTMVNPAFTSILGYSQEELLSKPFIEFVHPDDVTKTQEETENELVSGKSVINFKNRYQCKDGSYRWLKWRSHIILEKGIAYGVAHDITLQMQAEETLAKQTEKLRLLSTELEIIIDNIPGLVFYKDTNNRFIRVNKFMSDAHKLTKDKLEGLSMFDLYPKEMAQAYFDDDLNVIQSKKPKLNIDEPWETEAELRWVNTSKIPNIDNEGNVIGIIGVSMDVTERKKHENIINQQNSELKKLNADKDRFITILAHDLKSPFSSILGFLHLLTHNIRKYDIDKIEKQLNFVNQSVEKTFYLLEDILTWVRANSGKIPFEPKKMNFGTICIEVIDGLQLAANNKNITVNNLQTDEIIIFADKNMLTTVLRNLISNAIKFTNKGGIINVFAKRNYENIEISISDNGIGMTAGIKNNIFDISQKISTEGTNNETGTGLGLLLCKEFVEKHGGKIWVESEVDKGSDFKFTIPVKDE